VTAGSGRLDLTFHGIPARVTCDDPEALELIEHDFGLFLRDEPAPDAAAAIDVRLVVGRPPVERIPRKRPLVRTKDAVVYRHGDVRVYDSDGAVLVIYDMHARRAEIHSLDRDLLREKCYLLLMTRIGEELDRRGLHRVHAMGVVHQGLAVLCLLPSGGGKTTLAMSLLALPDYRLLSEEVPLLSRAGLLHAFPVRMGVVAGTPLDVPDRYLQMFKRSRQGAKVLIDTRYFAGLIASPAEPGIVFVGRRVGPGEARVVPLSRIGGLAALLGACVAGNGIPQLLEYLLRLDLGDFRRQVPILWSRLLASVRLVRRSAVYELWLGPDREVNARLVAQYAAMIAAARRAA
jgi:hypothetical protein